MAESCAEKTFAKTTISDIVSRAGVSRATFYKHFVNKHACFDAAVDHFVEKMEVTVNEAQSNAVTGPENVRQAIAAGLELMAASPAYTRLVVVEAIAVDPGQIARFRSLLVQALRISRSDTAGAMPSGSTIRTAYGQAQVLIANQLLAGRGGKLPDLLPDLVYIALLPFAGQEEALKQARMAG